MQMQGKNQQESVASEDIWVVDGTGRGNCAANKKKPADMDTSFPFLSVSSLIQLRCSMRSRFPPKCKDHKTVVLFFFFFCIVVQKVVRSNSLLNFNRINIAKLTFDLDMDMDGRSTATNTSPVAGIEPSSGTSFLEQASIRVDSEHTEEGLLVSHPT